MFVINKKNKVSVKRLQIGLVFACFVLSNVLLANLQAAHASATSESHYVNVIVTGDGSKWVFQYPQFGLQSKSLTIPKSSKVNLVVSTVGVSDTLWIPKLGVKVDANPFQNVNSEITSNNLGSFSILSVSLCDVHNKHMSLGSVKVLSKSNFDSWVMLNGGKKA